MEKNERIFEIFWGIDGRFNSTYNNIILFQTF